MTYMRQSNQRGFSLIELVITVTIIGIIAAIAIPAYNAMKMRGARTEAMSTLTEVAHLQERWYSNNGTYADSLATIDAPTSSENNKYTISLTFDSSTPDEFEVTATAAGSQLGDDNCQTFSLDQAGRRTSTDSGGNPSSGCWSK